MSFINKTKKIGVNTVSCGTELVTEILLEKVSFILTFSDLFKKKSFK